MTVAKTCFIALAVCVIGNVAISQTQRAAITETRTLIVFFDGLRPDYITPEAMPNLYKFKQRGGYGQQHHSVFPTVTRVNAAAYATGSYPAKSGLMGNSVYFPEVSKTSSLNTGEATELFKIAEATNGKLLTAISLGEILQSAGKKMMVFSSGSTGQALLQNHKISGGAIINSSMILPDSLKSTITAAIGPVPPDGKHKWVADALIRFGFAAGGPLVSAIWFTDPDAAAHKDGIGSPAAMAAIKHVDEQFGRIIDTLERRGLTGSYNILVSTDHGFVTYVGTDREGLSEMLVSEGIKKDAQSDDVVLAAGAIYIKDHSPETIRKIVALLHKRESVGAVFTKGAKPGDLKGFVEGTLSFESVHWNHPDRSADILVDMNWDHRKNDNGYPGASFSRGVAGHGSLSPYEVHIPLLVSGPAFRKGFQSNLPTSNVDLVPTILHIHRLQVPPQMDGRVMMELLNEKTGQLQQAAKIETIETSVKYPGGTYTLTLERSILGRYKYVNSAKVTRTTL